MTEEHKKPESVAVSFVMKRGGMEMFSSVSTPVPPGGTYMGIRAQISDELYTKMLEEFKVKAEKFIKETESLSGYASSSSPKLKQSNASQASTSNAQGSSGVVCPVCSAGMDRDKKDTKWICSKRQWRKSGDDWNNSGCQGETR